MLQRKPPSSLVSPPRWSWSKARSRWLDSIVLAGLAIAAVGIGHGNTRVLAGGLSVTVAGGWLSLRRVVQESLPSSSGESNSHPKDSVVQLINLCEKFHDLAGHQLQPENPNFNETHVQNALEKLLRQQFPNADIRKEYVVPQPYSHGCRIDFLLVDLQCAIEVKRVRPNHTERELIKELAIDFEVYRQARDPFKTLICFIYDPTARLTNPQGLRDLEGDRGQFQVKVAISQPRQSV